MTTVRLATGSVDFVGGFFGGSERVTLVGGCVEVCDGGSGSASNFNLGAFEGDAASPSSRACYRSRESKILSASSHGTTNKTETYPLLSPFDVQSSPRYFQRLLPTPESAQNVLSILPDAERDNSNALPPSFTGLLVLMRDNERMSDRSEIRKHCFEFLGCRAERYSAHEESGSAQGPGFSVTHGIRCVLSIRTRVLRHYLEALRPFLCL